jgi:hypothetical protein
VNSLKTKRSSESTRLSNPLEIFSLHNMMGIQPPAYSLFL